jgi:hypothetical protein
MFVFIGLTILSVIVAGTWLAYYEERLLDMTQWEPEEFESETRVKDLKFRIKKANDSIGRVAHASSPVIRKPVNKLPTRRSIYGGANS